MIKKLFLTLLLITINFTQILGAGQTNNNKDSPYHSLTDTQKKEDLEQLVNYLEQNQEHLYTVVPKETFYNAKQEIQNNVSNLSDTGFYYELQKLVALSKDAHTFIENDPIYSKVQENLIPIEMKHLDNKWYLTSCYNMAYKKYLGLELTEINGQSLSNILKLSAPYISYENNIRLEDKFTEMLNHADFLKHIGVIDAINDITFTIKDEKGTEIKFSVKNCTWLEMQNTEYSSIYKMPKTKQNANKIYEFFSLNDNAILVRYNSAKEDTSYPLSLFTEQLKKELENKNYKKVIIDLRDNKGGNYTLFPPTIEMIKQLKEKQNFETYALIGADTFSSGVIHAAQLQHETDAKLVGFPTGGNVYFYGNTNNGFELSNSLLSIICSTKYFNEVPGYKADTLYPDIFVNNTMKEYTEGIDKEIDTILDGAILKINNTSENEKISNTNQSLSIESVSVELYDDDDNYPYLHDVITNNTSETIAGYKIVMAAFDKEGNPLEQYWLGPNNEKTFSHTYDSRKVYLSSGQTKNSSGGWSLFIDDEKTKKTHVAYALYCIKEITFEDGSIWKNPDYDNWEKTYVGRAVEINILENYYPFIQTVQ